MIAKDRTPEQCRWLAIKKLVLPSNRLADNETFEYVYRLAFPEEYPFEPIKMPNGTTCSRYQLDKLEAKLRELTGEASERDLDLLAYWNTIERTGVHVYGNQRVNKPRPHNDSLGQ